MSAHLDASEDLDAKEKRAIVIVCEVVLTWTAATNLALDDTGSAPAKLARAYLFPFLLTARNPQKPVALPGERFNATKEEAQAGRTPPRRCPRHRREARPGLRANQPRSHPGEAPVKHPYNPYTSWQAMQAALSALRQEPPPRADHHLKCSILTAPRQVTFDEG